MSAPFEAGEKVLLIDQRDRTYLFALQAGATYHTHAGTLAHDDVIGQPEGTRVTTARGMVFSAFRPRFADFVLKMPRGAQVVYPKDLGPIVVYADVYPGRPGARGRDRVRRADDRPLPGRRGARACRLLRAPRGASGAGAGERRVLLREAARIGSSCGPAT